MPFFIPDRYLKLDYFGSSENSDSDLTDYIKERDFAFFAVNFGYSKKDYESLTPTEKAFIIKAYETKTVNDSTFIRNAVYNAINNAFRGKNKRFIELWKKQQKYDEEEIENDLKIIKENEEKEGKGWIALIYQGRRG